MKRYLYLPVSLVCLLLFGCKKYELDNPDFEVTADKTEVSVGEEINFSFQGDPPILYFYSGQFMNNYEQANGLEQKNVLMSFSTTTGNNGTQPNQLDVFITNEFDGNYQIDNIRATNWIRLTDEFTLATNKTKTPSTEIDILNRIDPNKSLHVAFRYITEDQTVNGGQNNWNVPEIFITTQLEDQEVSAFRYSTSGFGIFSYGNKQPGRSVVASSGLLFKGNATDTLLHEYTEDWAVSNAINLAPGILAVNKSISLKLFTETKKEEFAFSYDTPGTYKATFVGETHNVYGKKKVVKTIDITVNP